MGVWPTEASRASLSPVQCAPDLPGGLLKRLPLGQHQALLNCPACLKAPSHQQQSLAPPRCRIRAATLQSP